MNLTRKDIARRLGLSTETVRKHEKKLGLFPLRAQVSTRVYYPEKLAVAELRKRGFEL